MTLETRQVVQVARDGPRKLAGLAAVYERETEIGGARERIARGAFGRVLDGRSEVLAFVDHDPAKLMGRRSAGTLRLFDQPEGLGFEIDVPDTSAGRDALALAERGDLGGMSFGFVIPRGGERRDGAVRVLTEIDLREISIVSAWPAYEGTRVEARNRPPNARRALHPLNRWRP